MSPPGADFELPPGYTLVRRLGQSPLSEVFLVADDAGRRLALKLLRPSLVQDPRVLERWQREARLLAEIRHPNLIRSFGTLEVGGRPGLLLEYIPGESLREHLREGPIAWEEAARIGVQVARALEGLHRHGAVHRDVKPHNILLHPERGAVLADLGLVRRREDPTLTRQGVALGSPAYMSPEQARDPRDVGPEADLYSLGATLHHALGGKPPFLGAGVGEVIHRVLHQEPEALPESVPTPLQRVIATALAKERERRYSRVRDLRTDLVRVLTGYPPRLLTAYRLTRRRRMLLSGGGVGLLLLLGGTWWSGTHAPPPGDDPSGPPAVAAGLPPRVEPPGASLGTPSRAAPDAEERFRDWVRIDELAYRRYLARGELRRALDEVDTIRDLPFPPGADREFRDLHRAFVKRAEDRILGRAEEVAGEAEEILAERRAAARRGLSVDLRFDLDSWEQGVRRSWASRGLPVDDLPLRPGGADPVRLLRSAVGELRERQTRMIVERAALALPPKRQRVHRALRDQELAHALEIWSKVDPELLVWSQAGRAEDARMALLATLDAEELYRMEPERLRPRLAAGRSEQEWLLAQVEWCRGEVEEALAHMRPLLAERWPPDRDPAFWVREWERELQLRRVAATGNAPPPAIPAAAPEPRPPADPARSLAEDWAQRLPEARVSVRSGGVEVEWKAPFWGRPWTRSLPWDRLRWELADWRLEWELPPDATPPRLVRWLGGIELVRSSPRALPLLRVEGERIDGKGILPGIRQVLESRDGMLYLDGLELVPFAPSFGNRLELSAEAEPEFHLRRVWLRVVPRS